MHIDGQSKEWQERVNQNAGIFRSSAKSWTSAFPRAMSQDTVFLDLMQEAKRKSKQ
jgi:hypothetical protein